jgi:membrane-associated phospholipid phosphatase
MFGRFDQPWQRSVHVGLTLMAAALLAGQCAAAAAQSSRPQGTEDSTDLPSAPQPQIVVPALGNPDDREKVTLRSTPTDILKEQEAIWTVAITADHQVMSSGRLDDASLNSHASTASNGLLGGFVVAPVIIYGLGHIHHDDHATETGILAGEAMVDSLVVNEVLKAATMRERPMLDGAKGKFFQSSVGLDSSFPSTHSIIAWSSAAVIASEYPGPMTRITAYGLATGLSMTRVLARQHFPSDVLVGSAVGWLVGRYVFHKHHNDDY